MNIRRCSVTPLTDLCSVNSRGLQPLRTLTPASAGITLGTPKETHFTNSSLNLKELVKPSLTLPCCFTDKAWPLSSLAAPVKMFHAERTGMFWCPVCPVCQLSAFLSRGCLLRAVGPSLKPCCPGISGGRRVKGYSCVSCFLLQLLTRASIHQQALLLCPGPPLLPPSCQ